MASYKRKQKLTDPSFPDFEKTSKDYEDEVIDFGKEKAKPYKPK